MQDRHWCVAGCDNASQCIGHYAICIGHDAECTGHDASQCTTHIKGQTVSVQDTASYEEPCLSCLC